MLKREFSVRVAKSTDNAYKIDLLAEHAGKFLAEIIRTYPHNIKHKDIDLLPEDEILIFTVYFDFDSFNEKSPEILPQGSKQETKPKQSS